MKRDNGHHYEISFKTKCCNKGRNVKTKCPAWFQTFISRLEQFLMNIDNNGS